MTSFWVFVEFLEEYNKYEIENFSVYLTFNKLSNDISHFVIAQNFVISSCLRMTSFPVFVNFLEDGNRYNVEIFTVH